MCELLGLCFNQEVRPNISFKGFRLESKSNPDGWGIGFYPDKSSEIIKEPLEAEESLLSGFLENYPKIKSQIFISHVRLNSVSSPAFMNTHPFKRELWGKEYVFAHNGTLSDYVKHFDASNYMSVGKTDSEAAFCHMINKIREKGILSWNNHDYKWLIQEIQYINSHGRFNCLLSDGEYLFCYYDMNGYKSLYHLHRQAPYEHTHLSDEHFDIHLKKQRLSKKEGYIIATKPLTDEKWHAFKPGELRIFKKGRLIKKISI